MRLTRAAEYAIRCVLYLSNQEENVVVGRKEIALAMDIPDQYLGKIAQQLSRAGIIEILQGARGGFRLLKSPSDISLLSVIEAVMGEIFINDCVLRPTSCIRSNACAVHIVWEKARRQLRETLENAPFSQLIQKKNCLT
jgi:Rrf2 family transcriptional regulator, iron-sulfur cluster assembly transcription factor